jgi:hypothetical protein
VSDWIRDMLRSIAPEPGIKAPDGFVGVSRARVIEVGLDPLETYVWVADHGGHEGVVYRRTSRKKTLPGNPRTPLHPEPYLAIPKKVLEED